MTSDKIHLLFHDLIGPISSINMLSQICTAYITKFDLEMLEGKFKEEITSTFNNIFSYHDVIIEKLKLVAGHMNEIGEKDAASALYNDIIGEVEKIKCLEKSAKILYDRLLESDEKENLHSFAREVSKFTSVCNSLSKIINDYKNRLITSGKY